MKRLLCVVLALLFLLPLVGCGKQEPVQTQSAEEILAQRRQIAMDFMRAQLDFYWRCEEELTYFNAKTGKVSLVYEAGKIYRGLPYGQSGGTVATFLRSSEVDERGVYTVTGVKLDEESGYYQVRRMGSDCAATVWSAWAQISPSISADKRTTRFLTTDNGFLRVGDYASDPTEHSQTKKDCRNNGEQVMYEAYAQLLPADGVVQFNDGSGHAMMVVGVEVKRNQKNGEILGNTSFVHVIDQTSGNMNDNATEYVEALGEEVCLVGNTEKTLSFAAMFGKGYLPITIKELRDPTPVAEETFTLTVAPRTGQDLTALLQAITAASDRAVNLIGLKMENSQGEVVQECSMVVPITSLRSISMGYFLEEADSLILGTFDPDALAAGSYRLTCTARSYTGKTLEVTETFTVE